MVWPRRRCGERRRRWRRGRISAARIGRLWDVFEDQRPLILHEQGSRRRLGRDVRCAATNAALERPRTTLRWSDVIDQALLVVPTRYDAAAVTSMPSAPRGPRANKGQDIRTSSRSAASGSIVSSDGGVAFSSVYEGVATKRSLLPPTTCGGAPEVPPEAQYNSGSADHCAGTGNWHARPPKSKKHKKAKVDSPETEADMDEDEEFL